MPSLLSRFDTHLTRLIEAWPSRVRSYMIAASVVGLPIVTLGVGTIISLMGIFFSNGSLFFAGLLVMVALGVGSILKVTLRRKRPLTDYVLAMRIKSFSFPSGHSLGSVVSFGFFAYLIWTSLPFAIGLSVAIFTGLLCFFIGISRVYLGAHYPSDVIAGWMFGLLALAVIIGSVRPIL